MAQGIGGGIAGFKKIREGKKIAAAGQEGMDNFQWEELTNSFRDVQVSTAGAEMRNDQANTAAATTVEAGRSGGTRGIAATAGRAQAQVNTVARDAAANIDEQQKAIDMNRAQDQSVIRGMTEKRQSDELAGYGNMLDVGMDLQNQGMGDLVAAAGAIDSLAMSAATGGMSSAMGGGSTKAMGAVANNGGNMLG